MPTVSTIWLSHGTGRVTEADCTLREVQKISWPSRERSYQPVVEAGDRGWTSKAAVHVVTLNNQMSGSQPISSSVGCGTDGCIWSLWQSEGMR